jgi:hypothetical protein
MAKSITTGVTLSSADVRSALTELQTNAVDLVLSSAALAIGSSSKAKVKIVNTFYYMIDGVMYSKTTAEIAFTATTHDVANGKYAVFVLSVDSAGTVTITKSADAASLATVVFPTVPASEVVIGFVIINPTGTGAFDASTTELDDATVVPNAVYVNTPYPFNPNALAL